MKKNYTTHFQAFLLLFFTFILPIKAQAQCTVSIDKVSVSGCYLNAGQSKATVSVEISWTNAPTNGTITVSAAPASGTTPSSRTFRPGVNTYNYGTFSGTQTIVSPQVIAFEVDANAAAGVITAQFSNSCTTTANYTAPAACPIIECSGGFGGLVFYDFNADGVRNVTTATIGGIQVRSGEVEGPGGVQVKVIDNTGQTFTTTTDQYGAYNFSQNISYPVRVEYTNIPAEFNETSTLKGTDNGTTVQFFSAATCNAYLGVNRLTDYCQTSPRIFTSCYVNGDPLKGGSSGTAEALVSLPFNTAGNAFTTDAIGGANKYWAPASQVGAVWGMAYNRKTKKVFTAAIVRRHIGFGPQGIGGIYITDATNTNPTNINAHTTSFIDLDAAPFSLNLSSNFNLGSVSASANAGRPDLPSNKGSANSVGESRDPLPFTNAVKEGLGDLEISEDNNTLYTVNLNTKELVIIDITAFNADGTTKPTAAQSVAIPNPGCTNGEFRPWALKYHQGVLYVGGVCDGSNTAPTANERKSSLRTYIYTYENGTFNTTPIFDFPLTYPKGYPFSSFVNITGWYPWTDSWADFLSVNGNATAIVYPSPFLADIEFDTDGSMLLGFGDRTGMQTGVANYRPTNVDTRLYTNYSGGDVLKAYAKNGIFLLENNAKAGPFKGYGTANSQGPGFGEYFNDDWSFSNIQYHAEAGLGGLAIRPGSGQTLAVSIDPQDGIAWAGGIRLLNNNTGLLDDAYSIYGSTSGAPDLASGDVGKAAGIGDVELACDLPSYLEVGNRFWNDIDKNGVQDPIEPGINNVSIQLFEGTTATGTPESTTITSGGGQWYFNNTNVTGGLKENTDYTIKVNTPLNTGALAGFVSFTGKNAASGGVLADSDVNPDGTITFSTGAFGDNNHTFDIGVIDCPTITAPILANAERCAAGTLTATLTSACTTGTTLKIFSDDGLTTDVTSQFIVNSGNIVSPNISNTTTYYAACVSDEFPNCKSSGDDFILTINPKPAAPVVTDGKRCGNGIVNATITTACANGTSLRIFSDAALNSNVTGQFTMGTTTIISPSISNTTTYYATCFSTVSDCGSIGEPFVLTVTASPDSGTPTTEVGTCSGANLNDDALITVGSIIGDKASISTANATNFDGNAYASATTLVASQIKFENLVHGATYIIRIYNTVDCFKDITVATGMRTCCPFPNCVGVTVIKN